MLRIAVPDLVSNSYFPIIAAVELGCFKSEGFDASVDLLFPVPKTFEALRDGQLDFVVGSAHATLLAFPDWKGAKLLCAIGKHTYWFLVIRSDLNPKRGDLSVVKGLRIGAAPGVNLSLQRLLVEAGIDPEKNHVQIVPIPGAAGPNVSFGLSAAKALEEGKLDGSGPTAWAAKSRCAAVSAAWCWMFAAVTGLLRRGIILSPRSWRPRVESQRNPIALARQSGPS